MPSSVSPLKHQCHYGNFNWLVSISVTGGTTYDKYCTQATPFYSDTFSPEATAVRYGECQASLSTDGALEAWSTGASLPGCLCSASALECLSAFLHHSCPAPCSAPHQGCGWQRVNAHHVPHCSFCLPLCCQTWQRRSPTPREAGNMSPKWTVVRASFPAETCTKSAQTTCCQITPIRQSTTQARVNVASSSPHYESQLVSHAHSARAGRFASECIFDFSG